MTTNAVNDKKDNTTEDFASSSFFSDDASSWESSLEEGDHDVKGKDDGGECENFVKEENRAVSLVRKLAIAILLLGAAALSTSTYFLLRAREIKEFDNAFHDYATRVISTFEERMQRQTDMARFLASTAATLAERSGSTWPFVDAPDVDDVSLSLSGARSILFSPFVSRDQVTEWEEFSGKTITDKKEISLDENITTYMPFYQVAPTSQTPFSAQTFDLLQVPSFGSGLKEMFQTGDPLVTDFESNGNTTDVSGEKVDVGTARPVGLLFYPIFNGTKVAGAYVLVFHWHHFLQGILSPDENGLLGVLETCNASFSFQLDDGSAKYLGGDYSDAIFDQIGSKVMFANKECNYQLTVSPTKDMEESFTTNFPVIATSMVVLIFIVLLLIFFSYDTALWRRQKAVMIRAKQSNAIVTSLFPAAVRDRLMEEAEKGTLKPRGPTSSLEPTESLSLSQLNSSEADHQSTRSLALKPRDDVSRSQHTASRVIADLYPKCSVCFADLVGFTAWSSQRSPEMVFMLLEGIFARWDKIATRLEVFKVETIGDCYLSVTGLPKPQEHHAEIMAKFAIHCRVALSHTVRRLSRTLGPDTLELQARFGIHSGPVTAGVLRGERGRFQLFGDTVNTAARMESTGLPDKIQISASVQVLLRDDKSFEIETRGLVSAKGKGSLQTFWLVPTTSNVRSLSASISDDETTPVLPVVPIKPSRALQWGEKAACDMEKTARLVDWVVELLASHLNEVVAKRRTKEGDFLLSEEDNGDENFKGHPLDQFQDYIDFPPYEPSESIHTKQELGIEVLLQLREFVTTISLMYRDGNPFHCFDHAGKVLLNMKKFLSDMPEYDPLTVFASLFAALVHDLDHSGLTNSILVDRKAHLAEIYNFKSPLEQNSIDLAWEILLQEQFADLQACIFSTASERKLFRQVLVNLVLGTDIFGPLDQTNRWEKAFLRVHNQSSDADESVVLASNRKKTIILELLMQASDIAHTMQHFQVYSKWNANLFEETYAAYKSGSCTKDPTNGWYKGELWFFDNIVIPLAKRLLDCGAFGHAANDCLENAFSNRNQWKQCGEQLVLDMLEPRRL